MDNTFDRIFYEHGDLIGGVDESGVSEIAGPLVAACVILKKIGPDDDLTIFNVDDSKSLTDESRRKLVEVIYNSAIGIGIAEVSPAEVDYFGPHRAAPMAMAKAVMSCKSVANRKRLVPDILIVDGKRQVNLNIRQALVKEGDKKSLCTAAASVVAKVWRDDIMKKLHEQYPYYKWNNNKGALTSEHFDGLDKYGAQIGIHRVRQWPFTWKPKNGEKHPQPEWLERARKWRKLTYEKAETASCEKLWSLEPPFLELSPSYKTLFQKTATPLG